jgi:hypothetical protein
VYLTDANLVVAMGLVETDLADRSGRRRHFTFHTGGESGRAPAREVVGPRKIGSRGR